MLLQICSLFLIWIWSKRSKEKGKRKLSIPKLWSSLDTGFGPAWHATTYCFGTEVGHFVGEGFMFSETAPRYTGGEVLPFVRRSPNDSQRCTQAEDDHAKIKMLDDHFWIEKTGFFSEWNGYPSSFFHLLSKHAVLAGVATMTSALHRQFTKRRVAYAVLVVLSLKISEVCSSFHFTSGLQLDFCSTHTTHNQDHGVMNLYLATPTHKVICPTSTQRAITPNSPSTWCLAPLM